MTEDRVPIPLDTARTGSSSRKPVAKQYRLDSGTTQVLSLGARRFGIGDRFNSKNGAQRWAILYKHYRGGNRYGWNLAKPFIFQGMRQGLGIFAVKGGRIQMLRNLNERSVRIEA